MKRMILILTLVLSLTGLHGQSLTFNFNTGDAEMDLALNNVNIEAKADLNNFSADLSVTFSQPPAVITSYITVEKMEPAEVYYACEIAAVTSVPLATVVTAWKKNKGKGWGVIAKELGIKPGSQEFKALKGKTANRGKKKADKNDKKKK